MPRSVAPRSTTLFVSVVLSVLASTSQAQQGQVVQLPSISTFYYSGTVVVPDSGTGFLGGNRSSASQSRRNRFGSGLGSSQSVSQATVKATIIDLNEMDRQVLGGTPEQFMRDRPQRVTKQDHGPDRDGKAIVRYARKMYLDGKHSTSFEAYRSAISILSPKLRDLAAAEFKRVFGPAADQALRHAQLRR